MINPNSPIREQLTMRKRQNSTHANLEQVTVCVKQTKGLPERRKEPAGGKQNSTNRNT